MRYLGGLFNVQKYNNENKHINIPNKIHPDQFEMDQLRQTIDVVLDRSQYNKVDLRGLF